MWYGDLGAAGMAIKRFEAHERKEKRALHVGEELEKRYKVSKSGGLTYKEIKSFLKELYPDRTDDVSEAEVKW
jgi:hypothetical protein